MNNILSTCDVAVVGGGPAGLAAAIALRGGVAIWQGSTPKSLPSPVGNRTVRILGAPVAQQRLLIMVVAAVAVVAAKQFAKTKTDADSAPELVAA